MTRHQSFKRLVRTRMAKTGESYTAARATLLAAREPDAGPRPALATSDEMIRQRTGRGWEEWFDLLDGAGLAERPHRDIARWVAELQGADRQRRVGRESTAVGAGGRVLRCLVLAAVVAGLAAQARVDGLAGGLVLGLVLWIGFPAVLWVGAIVHENIRWRLAAIHAGDWFVKLLAVGAVVSVWP